MPVIDFLCYKVSTVLRSIIIYGVTFLQKLYALYKDSFCSFMGKNMNT